MSENYPILTLKDFLREDTNGSFEYLRVYVYPNEIVLMKHIKQKNKHNVDLSYSVISEKIKCRFVPTYGFDMSDTDSDYYHNFFKRYPIVFNLHSYDAKTVNTFLELYCMKKGSDMRIEYYPINHSNFTKDKGIGRDSLTFQFKHKEKWYTTHIDNIYSSAFTMLMSNERYEDVIKDD